MVERGFGKFNFRKMDIYRFMDAYESGCKKMKLNDEDMIAMLLFFLDSDTKKDYLELQIQNPSSSWKEFRANWVNKYHKQTYNYCWKYLSSQYIEGPFTEFARKKSEVIRKFCKLIPDTDLIQIINWSLPSKV